VQDEVAQQRRQVVLEYSQLRHQLLDFEASRAQHAAPQARALHVALRSALLDATHCQRAEEQQRKLLGIVSWYQKHQQMDIGCAHTYKAPCCKQP
jgi:23S rRNA C2498 (ribose-2'-O)-methylase RlmM